MQKERKWLCKKLYLRNRTGERFSVSTTKFAGLIFIVPSIYILLFPVSSALLWLALKGLHYFFAKFVLYHR